MSQRHVQSLRDIRAEVVAFDPARFTSATAWSPAQVLVHCAQSLEYGLVGFPRAKSRLFQATLGRFVLGKFLRQGFMRHDTSAAIPGAPAPEDLEPRAAVDRLVRAIDAFEAHDGSFAPHFAYGPVDKQRYALVQAMHIADHLGHFQSR